MVISKILEATLTAGTTTVTFTDTEIPNSIITTSCSDPDLYPIERSLSGNTVTLTYEAQSVDVYVALYIIKDGVEIIDSLESESDSKALSAKQGKALKGLIDAIVIPSVPSDLEDLDDVVITEPADGQVLLYNNGVWVNGDITPGGSNMNYSTSEQEVGTWIDNSKIYQISIDLGKQTIPQNSRVLIPLTDYISNLKTLIKSELIIDDGTTNVILPSYQVATFSTYGLAFTVNKNDGIVISRGNASGTFTYNFVATLWYTKTS